MIKIEEILKFLESEGIEFIFSGNKDVQISGFSSLGQYRPNTMTWIKNLESIPEGFECSNISLAVAQKGIEVSTENTIKTPESKHAFFAVLEQFFMSEEDRPAIGHGTYISLHVKLGNNVKIGHNCSLDGEITIGDNTIIWDNVTIINRVEIGKNCTIQSGVRIGHDGYGYTEDLYHAKTMIKHFGGVYIGDDVFIGPNCSIYRGTIDNTKIGNGCKIDGNNFFGHNVILGKRVSVIAGTVFYGSVLVGDDAYIATSYIKNQTNIGQRAFIGMGSVVTKDVPPDTTVAGVPAKPLIKENK